MHYPLDQDYLVDSIIHTLNKWGLSITFPGALQTEQNFSQLGEIEEAKDFLGRDLGWVLRVVRLRIDKSW